MRLPALLLAAFALLPVPGPVAAGDVDPPEPALEIVSRLGPGDRKLFNDESIRFLARNEADPAGAWLRGVVFTLLEPGGHPERSETVIARSEDGERWGRPPSSLSLPLAERSLDPGSYRLRADARGYRHDEITIDLARLAYRDLDTEHTKRSYAASFRIRLEDPSETRNPVPIRIRVEGPGGEEVDSARGRLVAGARAGVFTSPADIRLSSRVRRKEEGGEFRPLRVVPGSRLVVRLDEFRFAWPVPLPPEEIKQASSLGRDR